MLYSLFTPKMRQHAVFGGSSVVLWGGSEAQLDFAMRSDGCGRITRLNSCQPKQEKHPSHRNPNP